MDWHFRASQIFLMIRGRSEFKTNFEILVTMGKTYFLETREKKVVYTTNFK